VPRKICGAKRYEVTGEWRLLKEVLYDLYFSPSIIRAIPLRRMRLVGHLARMGYRRAACRDLVGKPRRRWEDNVKMEFREEALGHGLD
jgi:hypothetical protein